MAFITCPKCGKQISDIVSRCVRCGCNHKALQKRIEKRKSSRPGEKSTPLDWLKLIAFFAGLAVIVFIFGGNILPVIGSAAVTFFGMVADVVRIITNL